MKAPIIAFALILVLTTATAAPDQAFINTRDSFRAAFGLVAGMPVTASDRLSAVRGVATFGHTDSTELLMLAVVLEYERIDRLLKERDLMRSGNHPEVKGRSPAPSLLVVKQALDAEYQVVEAIEKGLSRLTDQKAIGYLAKFVLPRGKHWRQREIAARTLARVGDRGVIPALAKGLKDKDPRIRTASLIGLGAMRAEEAFLQILPTLKDKDWMVRSAAIESLGLIRDARAFLPLLKQLQIEEGLLRDECVDALERITGQELGDAIAAWRQWWVENGERALRGERLEPKAPKQPDSAETGRYYHEIEVKSKRTIFILDVSESMSYSTEEFQEKPKEGEISRLDLAKRELTKTLNHYRKEGTFGLIAFHTIVKAWRPRIVPASKVMRQDAIEWIESLDPTGTTNIYGAMEMAFKMAGMGIVDKYYPPAADTIFLLSDGAPTNQDLSADDAERILRAVREWNRMKRMRIHTIGLKGHDVMFMRRLAKENGGMYISRE